MKKMTKLLGFLAFVSIAVLAGRTFTDPTEAALANPQVKNYLNAGFVLEEVITNQYRYSVEPNGTFAWGRVNVQLVRHSTPARPEASFATVTCHIEGDSLHGTTKFRVNGVDVVEGTIN